MAHHLKVLCDAGLVRRAHERRVRGGTERCFVRSARRVDFAREGAAAQTALAMQTVGEKMAAPPVEPYITLRHI